MVVSEEKMVTEDGFTVKVKIHDDYCKNRTEEETKAILDSIAKIHVESLRRIKAENNMYIQNVQ